MIILSPFAFAISSINDVADNVIINLQQAEKMIAYMAYIAGLGFMIASFYKFKQHKDNPTQVPVGNPITMIAIATLLLFIGSLVAPIGETIFGTSENTGAKYAYEA